MINCILVKITKEYTVTRDISLIKKERNFRNGWFFNYFRTQYTAHRNLTELCNEKKVSKDRRGRVLFTMQAPSLEFIVFDPSSRLVSIDEIFHKIGLAARKVQWVIEEEEEEEEEEG